jgi:hypothetical protein
MEYTYIPYFPFTGSQAIVASDRVTLLSKTDSVLVFGEKAVALSSKGSVNLDATEGIIFNPGEAKEIKLGVNANQSVIKGDSFIDNLILLLDAISNMSSELSKISETNLASAVPLIAKSATNLNSVATVMKANFRDTLSTVTKTE